MRTIHIPSPKHCPACGQQVKPRWEFCAYCSAPLSRLSVDRPGVPRLRRGRRLNFVLILAVVALVLFILTRSGLLIIPW